MDSQGTDKTDELAVSETPEDVAVLYSWANLHGAKYRDFSASRREYRAQLRHRAAQQVREQALLAQAEAEAAADAADSAERRAVEAAKHYQQDESDSAAQESLREAEEAARTAAAERVEAARRAEAAAVAEAATRREEREIAEAHASAQRQAARYADSEIRRRFAAEFQPGSSPLPGATSDSSLGPTQPPPVESQGESLSQRQPPPSEERRLTSGRFHAAPTDSSPAAIQPEQRVSTQQVSPRRPQGYRPDDASGVRQIYRGPDYDAVSTEPAMMEPVRHFIPVQRNPLAATSQDMKQTPEPTTPAQTPSSATEGAQSPSTGQRQVNDSQPEASSTEAAPADSSAGRVKPWPSAPDDASQTSGDPLSGAREAASPSTASRESGVHSAATPKSSPRPVSPFSQALVPSDSTRGRRALDEFDYQQSQGFPERERRRGAPSEPMSDPADSGHRAAYVADPAGPAWLYAPPAATTPARPNSFQGPPAQSSVADTLQHSRERVASRWFALKGVFEQPGQELPEAPPVRQKETRTPVLAVFSLAGGVGKTSLVATVGRALSSMGEKVLLTDTTSHGLLPFYFGASELRQGTVRTFSPPSGSTDAPIYLVSYDDQTGGDAAAQESLSGEIINNSRGTHRILLDLTPASSWIVRRLFRMNPTILVPVAPDMNSVISLQSVEKFFHGINDGDGRPLQPFYVINQFDTSLPLHLDVREVLRRQLGDRLLPFVIRRAPSVSEALAEGMTVVDYAPDAPVTEDYLNVATWLRTVAAPATAGFRNVRWSER
jgi:cellulose synthase operon protein YhjQ